MAHLVQRGVPALGVDQSATAVALARRSGAPALRRDVFEPLPGTGRWQTVLLADGNVGLGGDPWRILRPGRRTAAPRRALCGRIRLGRSKESTRDGFGSNRSRTIGPWFRWASVGVDCVSRLADDVGLAVAGVHPIGRRVVASLAAT